jgi:hypothetical protein
MTMAQELYKRVLMISDRYGRILVETLRLGADSPSLAALVAPARELYATFGDMGYM